MESSTIEMSQASVMDLKKKKVQSSSRHQANAGVKQQIQAVDSYRTFTNLNINAKSIQKRKADKLPKENMTISSCS